MRRTASRPLPTRRACSRRSAAGLASCFLLPVRWIFTIAAGLLARLLGVVTCLSYLLAYTPLKTRTVWATLVGAIPGAMPPLIGWAAATGSLGLRRLDAIRHSVPLAVSAFPRHRLDVPRRLRARRHPDASGCGPEGNAHLPRKLLFMPPRLSPSACWPRLLGLAGVLYFFGALVLGTVPGPGLPVGRPCQNQHPRQVADARHRDAYPAAARPDDVRQASEVEASSDQITPIRNQQNGIPQPAPRDDSCLCSGRSLDRPAIVRASARTSCFLFAFLLSVICNHRRTRKVRPTHVLPTRTQRRAPWHRHSCLCIRSNCTPQAVVRKQSRREPLRCSPNPR